jgi:pantoate--beta-alanine ligase
MDLVSLNAGALPQRIWRGRARYANSLVPALGFAYLQFRRQLLTMIICDTKSDIQEVLTDWRDRGERIGAVMTMGALHEGHLSLVDMAARASDKTVATIFVNPLQFGPNEDFETYPRTIERDLSLLEARRCDIVFTPDRSALFPPDFSTKISVAGVGEDHCAISRPQFFDGVATIVMKLLMILSPHLAVFGEKDYQQLMVIRRLVRDLDIDVEIVGAPTVRESDGLALSSRNQYLTPSERSAAPALYETMVLAAERLRQSDVLWPEIGQWADRRLRDAGFSKVDYFHPVDANTLDRIKKADRPARLLAAAWIGKTRLIDNIPIAVSRPHS